MLHTSEPDELDGFLEQFKRAGNKIGLVPTMGSLHEGHLSLVKTAKDKCDKVCVSIFVNPLQFGPDEDFDKYPRGLDRDLCLLGEAGVDLVFSPTVRSIDLNSSSIFIHSPHLGKQLCGETRINFFQGVLTIVNKLFHIFEPDLAVFGKKDYQQLFLIKQMVKEFGWKIDIVSGEIVRESNGLAMSSRNQYLTDNQRDVAAKIYQALSQIKSLAKSLSKVEPFFATKFCESLASIPELQVEYAEIRDQQSLAHITEATEAPSVLLTAVKLGGVRLIDNVELLEAQ